MDAAQLDAVSVVLGGIAASAGAGAGEVVKDMTKTAITATRDRLVALVRGRLTKDPVGEAKLTVYAAEPTPANGQALHGHLVDAGIEQDQEILTLAHELLHAAGPAALGPGSVAATVINQVNKEGGTGFIGGQHTHHHGGQSAANVRWDLIRVHGSVFELRNIGSAQAHAVAVTSENALRFDPPDSNAEWHAGSGHQFLAVGSFQTGRPVIAVTWQDDGGERHGWTRPLPR